MHNKESSLIFLSHSIWRHPLYEDDVRLSGKDGKDAKPYQEQAVNKAIQKIKSKENG